MGRVLIIGGSKGLTGALQLAGLGALRSGCGLVTLCCPLKLEPQVKGLMPELMTFGLGDEDSFTDEGIKDLFKTLPLYDVVAVGPGLGRGQDSFKLLKTVLSSEYQPQIYDADALYHLGQNKELIKLLHKDSILTPHPGEMAFLTGKSIAEIEANRIGIVQSFCKKYKVNLILKGSCTVIGNSDGEIAISPVSCANLAVGGSGDVLTGIISSLKAKGLNSMQSTCIGVYWHGNCGLFLKEQFPFRGNIASEIANALPEVARRFYAKSQRCHEQKCNNSFNKE